MVVDAGDKSRQIPTFVRTNNELLPRICTEKKTHNTVPLIVHAVEHEVHIPSVLGDNSQILNQAISFHNKPAPRYHDMGKDQNPIYHGKLYSAEARIIYPRNLPSLPV